MLPPEECKAPVGQVFIPLPLMNPERLVASLTLHRAKFKNEVPLYHFPVSYPSLIFLHVANHLLIVWYIFFHILYK